MRLAAKIERNGDIAREDATWHFKRMASSGHTSAGGYAQGMGSSPKWNRLRLRRPKIYGWLRVWLICR